MNKIIVRVKGGLGNQLFCYAAARRLALVNSAELVIDDVTGFVRDVQYRRQYMLGRFNIAARKATPAERMEPFERYRRGIRKLLSCRIPFEKRSYVEQESIDFDARLLMLKAKGTICLDGYWQSENYFKDVGELIRQDLRIVSPEDEVNQKMAKNILACDAVAVHIRFFDNSEKLNSLNNLEKEYYFRAFYNIKKMTKNPHFFIFSDNLDAASKMIGLPEKEITCVDCNQTDDTAYADLWLMTHCKHFVIANSTFSWWGAWLAESRNPKSVIISGNRFPSKDTVPSRWIVL
ncbi:MAG: alpha-1,2-fucosyltransferase [Candidatus Aceula meridiana]|nr:alpha-1,2-fucosyltransferase [Candidatus Aceula meridiana]